MSVPTLDVQSTANQRARAWAGLSRRSERDRTGTFLIEGRRETLRALEQLSIHEVIWCPELDQQPMSTDVPVTRVSVRVFAKISRRQNPDGWAATASTPDLSLDAFRPDSPALVLVADGLEKPGNIGAMLRTCDAFGAGFIGSGLGTDIVNPNAVRSAQGSLFAVATAAGDRSSVIEWCQANTIVVVADGGGDATLWELDMKRPTTIVVGAEHSGVDPRWFDVGIAARIPMGGIADSLNASVSSGVFLAEALRQRSG